MEETLEESPYLPSNVSAVRRGGGEAGGVQKGFCPFPGQAEGFSLHLWRSQPEERLSGSCPQSARDVRGSLPSTESPDSSFPEILSAVQARRPE